MLKEFVSTSKCSWCVVRAPWPNPNIDQPITLLCAATEQTYEDALLCSSHDRTVGAHPSALMSASPSQSVLSVPLRFQNLAGKQLPMVQGWMFVTGCLSATPRSHLWPTAGFDQNQPSIKIQKRRIPLLPGSVGLMWGETVKDMFDLNLNLKSPFWPSQSSFSVWTEVY